MESGSEYRQLFGTRGELNHDIPMYFSPSTLPHVYKFESKIPNLDKQYISLVYDFREHKWIFVEKAEKEDTDIYGDDYKDAELNTWNNYRNPVKFEDLILDKKDVSDQMYFINQTY